MATGHRVDTLDGFVGQGEESVAAFLAAEPEEEPGSCPCRFVYHNGASRVLALAVQRRTGERLLDYLRPRLLDPLGIDRRRGPLGRNRSGLQRAHVSTDAVARLGLLLLQDGVWEEPGRLLDASCWVMPLTGTVPTSRPVAVSTTATSEPGVWAPATPT